MGFPHVYIQGILQMPKHGLWLSLKRLIVHMDCIPKFARPKHKCLVTLNYKKYFCLPCTVPQSPHPIISNRPFVICTFSLGLGYEGQAQTCISPFWHSECDDSAAQCFGKSWRNSLSVLNTAKERPFGNIHSPSLFTWAWDHTNLNTTLKGQSRS